MKPHTFYAGSTIIRSYYSNSKCTGAATESFDFTSGDCYLDTSGALRYKTTAVTKASSPVSAPTTVISPVSSPATVISPVSSPTTTKSPVKSPTTTNSPVSSPTTSGALTGYGFYAEYLESSCSTFLNGAIYPLNTCLTFNSDNTAIDVKVTATSSAYFIQQYSDSTCTVTVGTAEPTRYTTECSSTKEKFFVQSSMQPPVSEAIFTIR
jgi:hypothetical protein